MNRIAVLCFCGLAAVAPGLACRTAPPVMRFAAAGDSGPRINPAPPGGGTGCPTGHPILTQKLVMATDQQRYVFVYSGCQDPSHGERRPFGEGNLGMTEPCRTNWYYGGFLFILINGTDACAYRTSDIRALETGRRGAVQIVWEHPDAQVGLRLVTLPGSNHVLAQIHWRPRPGAVIKTVAVKLRCYPSFFTVAASRQGDRRCCAFQEDVREGESLTLALGKGGSLHYFDTVFDPARGEGDGSCAAVVTPEGLIGGEVVVSEYPVDTTLSYQPEAGEARLALYEFPDLANAAAAAYLAEHGERDLAELRQLDFRPAAVAGLDLPYLRTELQQGLAQAGAGGQDLAPQVRTLLASLAESAEAVRAGDWLAEGRAAEAAARLEELRWRLKIAAILNPAP